MRIFIAIPISKNLQDEIARYRGFYPDLPARWLEGKNLHLTLIPPWEVAVGDSRFQREENIIEIEKKIRLLENKLGEFEMKFDNVSFGPNRFNPPSAGRSQPAARQSPRLIWATGQVPHPCTRQGCKGEGQKIIELKKSLERVLNKKSERDEFLLHLTIARFRPEDFKKFPVKEINDKVVWKDIAEEFVIMKSNLSPKGADYEILKRFTL